MIPTWMIKEIERQRRERERASDRPQLRIELPVRSEDPPATPARSTTIVIDLFAAAS